MKTQGLTKPGGVGALLATVLVLAYGDECCAQKCIENPGSGPRICADWNEGDDPDHPDDFEVTFSDVAFPNIELKAESMSWRLWSEDPANPNGIGDMGIISSPYPENFGVEIEGPSETAGAGAPYLKEFCSQAVFRQSFFTPSPRPSRHREEFCWNLDGGSRRFRGSRAS